jgi:histidine triad (HIT) family protein
MTSEDEKQIAYRDARITGKYDGIWQSTGKCVFCDLKDKYIIHEENGMVLTIAVFAYIDGHAMVVPRRHVRSIKELTSDEWEASRKLMYIAKKMIREIYGIKGLQYIIRDGGIEAQSTVSDHLHIHCMPFDAPDLSVWNYRKLANTPLENANLYKSHKKKIEKLSKRFSEKYENE